MRWLRGKARESGEQAEELACRYLQTQGLRLVTRNHRCRRGEIDLIMEDGESLVFVEVRYRASARFGSAAESVDARKRTRLIAAAGHFLQQQRRNRPCRFDVVAISGAAEPDLQWITNAFEAE